MQRIATSVLMGFLMACSGGSRPTGSTPAADEPAPPALSGQALAESTLAQWQQAHPDRNWEQEVRRSHPNIPPPADNGAMVGVGTGQGEGHSYGRYAALDIQVWERETSTLVLAGARIFHSAEEMGGTVGVSCDMCHPDAANTHPETYPKFQVQMGRVALLRDMINWCLVNPVRAEPWAPDDPRMRALEAYILAQRDGTALDYGRH